MVVGHRLFKIRNSMHQQFLKMDKNKLNNVVSFF